MARNKMAKKNAINKVAGKARPKKTWSKRISAPMKAASRARRTVLVDECLRLHVDSGVHMLDALLQCRDDVVGFLKQATIEFEELNCIKDDKITVSEEHAQQHKGSWFAALISLAVKFEVRHEAQLAKTPPFDDCSPNKEAT